MVIEKLVALESKTIFLFVSRSNSYMAISWPCVLRVQCVSTQTVSSIASKANAQMAFAALNANVLSHTRMTMYAWLPDFLLGTRFSSPVFSRSVFLTDLYFCCLELPCRV